MSRLDVVVVGAGFAGLYLLHRLREIGMSVCVIEAGEDIGGTWYWNRYPGARCDVESFMYSYSFSKELEQDWVWPERYGAQPDILRYLHHVAERFDLRRDIHLGKRVISADFDESSNQWLIRTHDGESYEANFCVMATGCLSVPKAPDLPGIDEFAGNRYHTANWPVEGVDFHGRTVGLVGTGSSGIQSTPLIAAQAEHLTVFQRNTELQHPRLEWSCFSGDNGDAESQL